MADRYWVGGSGTWSSTTKWSATSGGTSGASVPTTADNVIFDANSDAGLGAITVTLTVAANCLALNLSGIDVNLTFTGAFALNVYGNFTMSGSQTVDCTGLASSQISLLPSAQRAVTGNGGTLTGGILVNNASFGITLQDTFKISGLLTHTAGNITLSGNDLYIGSYSSAGASARSLSFASYGTIFVTGTGTTPWTMSSSTSYTITNPDRSTVKFTSQTAASTRTLRHSSAATTNTPNFYVTTGTDTFDIYAASNIRTLDFTGFSGTWTSTAFTLSGDLVISSGMTCTAGSGVVTITNADASQIQYITTNNKVLGRPITYTAVSSGQLSLNDNLYCDAAFIFNLGTLNLNDYTLRCTTWASSSGSTRVINFSYPIGWDTGTIECTGASFTMTNGTGFSYNYTSHINMSQATASAGTKTINCTGITTFAQSMDFYVYNDQSGSNLSITANSILRSLDLTYSTGSNAAIAVNSFTLYGDCLMGGSSTFTATTTGVLTFAATSTQGSRGDGVQKISLNATGNFNRPITKNGSGTLELNSDIRISSVNSVTFTHSAGTIDLQGYSLTLYGSYSSSGTTARKITHGGNGGINYLGKIYINAGASVTAWDTGTATNWTSDSVYGYDRLQVFITGTGTKTLNFGTIAEGSTPDITCNQTAGVNTIYGNVNNVTLNNGGGYTFTTAGGGLVVYGDFTIVGNLPVLNFATGGITFAKTSDTQTVTSLGEIFNGPFTKNGAGTLNINGALQIGTAAALTSYTHSGGTIDIMGYTVTIYGTVTISTSNTRRIQNGLGDNSGLYGKFIVFNSTATTVYAVTGTTGLTTDGNILFDIQGATNGVTVVPGTIAEASNPPSFLNSRTSGTMTINAGNIQNLTCNFTTAISTTLNIYGNVTIGSSGALSAVTSMTFAKTSSTQTLTSNGKTITSPSVIKDGAGTLQLQDAMTLSAIFTHTAGTFDVQGFTVTIPSSYSSLNSNTRVLKFGSGGKITLSGSSTVWDCTSTNFSVNGLANGTISTTSTSAKTFSGGGGSYPKLEHSGSINGIGNLTIAGNNTFYNLTNTTRPTSIIFTGGTNQTFTDFNVFGAFDQNSATYSTTFDTTPKYIDYTAYTLDSNIGQPGYTVEFFIKFNSLSTTSTLTGFTQAPASSPYFAANTTAWNVSNAGFSTRGTATGLTLTTGVWYHFAYFGIANNTYMAVNGVVKNLNNVGGANGYTPNGIWGNTFKLGNGPVTVSNFRITVNGGLYSTSGFTPIVAKPYLLEPVSNTVLLTLNASTFVDSSTRAATVTTTGSPTMTADTVGSSASLTPQFNRVTLTSTNTTPFSVTKTSGADISVNCCSISYSNAVGSGGIKWRSYNTLGNLDQGNNQDWVFGNKFMNFMMG